MRDYDQKVAMLHAQMPEYKSLVRVTKRFVKEALHNVQSPYVACSFGKDSSVMLHIVRELQPDIPVRFAVHPETEILDDYRSVVNWWLEKYDINLTEVFCEGSLIKVKHHQRKMLNDTKADAFFVGIRAEESVHRRMSIRRYGKFHRLSTGMIRIAPLGFWRERDIAAYLYEHDLPMLSAYNFYGVEGRTSSGVPRSCVNMALNQLKIRDPQRFNSLCEIFPEARFYV